MNPDPRYVGFWARFAAFLLDSILLGALYALIGWFEGNPQWSDTRSTATVLLAWLYFAGLESSRWQATLGKKALDIRVENLRGERLSFLRATGRYFAWFLSLLPRFIGFLIIPFTRRKQGLHDMIAGSVIVHG